MKKRNIISFIFLIVLSFSINFINFEKVEGAEKDLYLSDINYVANKSFTKWGSILKDKAGDGKKISVKIEGSFYEFDKGMWAHANSTLVYDISSYNYKYFTTYMGLNVSAASSSNGVKFYVYTSNDGVKWDLRTEENPEVSKPGGNSRFVQIELNGAKYLKLEALDNGGNGNDHSVYADAKLTNEEADNSNAVNSVEYYDELLKTKFQNATLDNKEYELALLQREFVSNVGQYALKRFFEGGLDNQKAFDWLFKNVDNLRMYISGGAPDGSYMNSLTVLSELYKKYSSDLENKTLLNNKWDPSLTYGDLYKKMMISLSLTHSTQVSLWMQPGEPENQSNAVKRYEIYKDMHEKGMFKVSTTIDYTPLFEALHVEEMRFVLNNIIDDEEIIWLYDYTQKRIKANPGREETFLTPHPYMKYIWPDYAREDFHDESLKEQWDTKYEGVFSKYDITFRSGLYKLWMNLENGAVCGGISKIGSNIRGVHGIPSSVISQPGHAALIYYRKLDDGRGYWTIDNDVSGWALSGKTERLSLRMPLGWGDQEYIKNSSQNAWVLTYVLLAQAALNDFDNYQESLETLILADVYKDDPKKQEQIYRDVLDIEPLNIDAWYGLIELYRQEKKSEQDFYELGQDIIEALKYYPLPMYHLVEEISKNLTSPEYSFKFTLDETRALTEASKATSADSIQASAVKAEANYLLGVFDSSLATFSFDGDDANKIILSSKYDDNGLSLEYSLDNKKTWKQLSFTANEEHSILLSDTEIKSITAENDIYVHIVGTNRDDENNLYKIDITSQEIADDDLYANDLENRIIGINSNMEWRLKGSTKWTSYATESPDLTGEKTVEVRIAANGTKLVSESKEYHFTTDSVNLERKYIPIYRLSIADVSTEATGNQGNAIYSIDGNINTRWHSAWNGSDHDKFIVIKFDKPVALSAIEYQPAGGGNGKILTGQILGSLDGETFEEITTVTWENNETLKSADFDEAALVQYVKIVGVNTSSASSLSFMSAKMFNFYEDATKLPQEPTAEIAYSTISPTNQNVVARLVNANTKIKITNNNGSDSYTFTKNGEFTFEYVDENGLKGTSTAKVDWIDKVAPVAKVSYKKINKEVIVTFDVNENVYILDAKNKKVNRIETEDGKAKYIYFLNNNEKAEYKVELDENGIEKNIAVLNQYERATKITELDEYGFAKKVTYYDGNGNVIENPSTSSKDLINANNVKISNPLSYTFSNNGEYNFKIQDMAGNVNLIAANVNTLGPIAIINYSTKDETADSVTATITFLKNTEDSSDVEIDTDVIITSEGGNTHVFLENGSFTFTYKDASGHEGSAVAVVDWIKPKQNEQIPNEPEEEIDDNEQNKEDDEQSTPTVDDNKEVDNDKNTSESSNSAVTNKEHESNSQMTNNNSNNESNNTEANENEINDVKPDEDNTDIGNNEKPSISDDNKDEFDTETNNSKNSEKTSISSTIINVLIVGGSIIAMSFLLCIMRVRFHKIFK